jgi:cytochrome c oxidase assembly protein subunit 15
LHGFAVFVASVTLILIVAGALVTSNDAGLSVPDWPTSFGSYYKIPQWTGGIRYEHGHRMVAQFVGFCTIILAGWTWVAEKRRWLRNLAIAALATVIVQGILGGITVLHFLPPAVSSAHAAVAHSPLDLRALCATHPGRDVSP